MPWCQDCAKYFVPNALTVEGKCPKCGREIAEFTVNGQPLDRLVTHKTLDLRSLARSNGQDEKIPWHFKLLVSLLVAYLTWRVVSLFI